MLKSPLEQFLIKPIVSLSVLDYSIIVTNSTLAFILIYLSILFCSVMLCRRVSTVPNKLQALGEITFIAVENMLLASTGKKATEFFPLIFSVFIFVLISNVMGIVPCIFSTTSHIMVTFTLSLFLFIVITSIGFMKHGVMYFSILLPRNTPRVLAPLMIVSELFAYLVRPISLAIRLAANITAGHVVLKVISSFITILGFLGVIPFIFLVLLTFVEIFVALLQAYIFSVLTCAYLSDALDLH